MTTVETRPEQTSEEIGNESVTQQVYKLLRRIYPVYGASTLTFEMLYWKLGDGGLALSSLEMLEALDELVAQGAIKTTHTQQRDTIAWVRKWESLGSMKSGIAGGTKT